MIPHALLAISPLIIIMTACTSPRPGKLARWKVVKGERTIPNDTGGSLAPEPYGGHWHFSADGKGSYAYGSQRQWNRGRFSWIREGDSWWLNLHPLRAEIVGAWLTADAQLHIFIIREAPLSGQIIEELSLVPQSSHP